MRGLSPIVGVVLMVGLAVTVSILVTVWITNWVVFQTSSPELTCALQTSYVIDSARWDNETNELLIQVTNKGKTPLYGFGVVLLNGTHVMQFDPTQVWQPVNFSHRLEREETVYLKLNSSSRSILGENLTREFMLTASQLKVTNEACRAVTAETDSIEKII